MFLPASDECQSAWQLEHLQVGAFPACKFAERMVSPCMSSARAREGAQSIVPNLPHHQGHNLCPIQPPPCARPVYTNSAHHDLVPPDEPTCGVDWTALPMLALIFYRKLIGRPDQRRFECPALEGGLISKSVVPTWGSKSRKQIKSELNEEKCKI